MSPRRVHILYEYGIDSRPHGSSYVRLLRPFEWLARNGDLTTCVDHVYRQGADVVLLDRLWRPDITLTMAQNCVDRIRSAGARFVYALDDNLMDLPVRRLSRVSDIPWPTDEHRQIVQFFLSQADAVVVTSEELQRRCVSLNPQVWLIPNALDETLLIKPYFHRDKTGYQAVRHVIGYMGTWTHDDDLRMLLPAWRAIAAKYRDQVEFQIIGVLGNRETEKELHELPVRYIYPHPEESEYPLFMLWFTSQIHWDIAVSPLEDSAFTRCKSDIKFLDYAAIGTAGIFSRVPAYSSVRHRETGWIAENNPDSWSEALDDLLSNESFRMKIAQNATRYLYRERTLAQCATLWKLLFSTIV